MKAIGYFREAIDPAGPSLAQQNKAFLEFCSKEGLEAASTFVDGSNGNGNGNGNGHGHAAGFRELLALVKREKGDSVVVVPSLDALGPEAIDAVRRYYQLEGLGAQVKAMNGAADPVAQWSSQGTSRIGDRVRAAMRRKAVKGEVLGRPPYGYKVGNRRRLELVPEEAVVVRYIFRLYLQEGMGIRLIARRLNEEGLKTRRGGNWSMVSIRDILRNRVYLGTYARFGVRVPGSHPSLVSADDFRRVQDRLNSRRTSFNPRVTSKFLLSGMVICGYCGNRLIGVTRKQAWKRKDGERVENTYRYYQCESRTNQSVCSYHTRRAEDLEMDVRAAVAALAEREPRLEQDATGHVDSGVELERLQARARSVDRRLQRYVEATLKGRMTRDRMHELSLNAARDRLAIDDALEEAERQLARGGSDAERAAGQRNAARRLRDEWDTLRFDERQELLRGVAKSVTVHDDGVRIDERR